MFHGFNKHQLNATALSLFLFVPSGVALEKGKTAWDALLDQGARALVWLRNSPTLLGADLNEAWKFLAYLVQNFIEAKMQIKQFLVLLFATWGNIHVLMVDYIKVVNMTNENWLQLTEAL